MGELSGTSLLALGVAALWILIAAAVAVLAARRLRTANAVIASARNLATLLELAPARPLVVRPDGVLEVDARLLRGLGLDAAPRTFPELAGEERGIVAEDLEVLAGDLRMAALGGARIARQVRIAGSS